jgi:pSer/pThr/pTyr-binding forkhead associated (FHA) protein
VNGEKLEIGIVCGSCRTFNLLRGTKCARCGQALGLRPFVTQPMAESAPPGDGLPPSVHPGTDPHAVLGGVIQPEVVASLVEEDPMEPARHYVCRSCSSAVPAGHKFCGRCGTPVPVQVREVRTNYFGEMQNPTKAKLILIRGEGMDGLSFHLKAEQHIVGREGQLIFPDDPFVSPRHANFFYRDGHLVVRDEGSLNGVYVRIRGSVPIRPQQTFLAGEQLFRLEVVEAVGDDGPEPDGTCFYASPRKDSSFRLSQVFRGDAVGMCVHANGTSMTVGRDGADLNFPEDLFMSGEHCRIDRKGNDFTLTDLNSRNGTYVRIAEERVLEHGDYVFIGRKLLRVEMNSN